MDYRVVYNCGNLRGITMFDSKDGARGFIKRVLWRFIGRDPISIQRRETKHYRGMKYSEWNKA